MKCKITEEQRQHLLKVYLERGFQAARPLTEALGVSERYPAKLARKHGHSPNYQRGRHYGHRTGAKDRRWQWAIERGAVSI